MSDNARGTSWWSRVFKNEGAGEEGDELGGNAEERLALPDPAAEIAAQLAATLDENEVLKLRLEQLRGVYEGVRDELAAERGQHRTLVAAHRSVLDQARSLQRLVVTLEEEKRALTEQLEAKTTQCSRVEAELAKRISASEALERRASSAERSAATSRRGAESARAKLDEQQGEHKETRARLESALRVGEERARALETARTRVRALEGEMATLKKRLETDAKERDEERAETSGRLDIVRARLEKVEGSAKSLEEELATQRAMLGQVRGTARSFALVAADALWRCVGARVALPLRLAWNAQRPDPRPDTELATRVLRSTIDALGLCSTVDLEPRGDRVVVNLAVEGELMASRGALGLPTWLVEYARAYLEAVGTGSVDPSGMTIDTRRGVARGSLSFSKSTSA